VSPLDRDPAIFISTFKSYEEMGLAYGRAASPKAAVTPEIAALANEITKDIDDKRGQAIAIGGWVKKMYATWPLFYLSGVSCLMMRLPFSGISSATVKTW
jgi:hypothetical protein